MLSFAGRLNTYCHVQFETVEGMERACQLTGSSECSLTEPVAKWLYPFCRHA